MRTRRRRWKKEKEEEEEEKKDKGVKSMIRQSTVLASWAG